MRNPYQVALTLLIGLLALFTGLECGYRIGFQAANQAFSAQADADQAYGMSLELNKEGE